MEGRITAFPVESIQPQEQANLPGEEAKMDPQPDYTRLEKWDDNGKPYLEEYVGVGKLKNKRVLITGGDSGIGRSVALLMAREGAQITIQHLPSEDKDARDVKAQIEKEGSKCLTVAADLLKRDECKRLVDEHVAEYGRIDVLVNNAGRQVTAQKHEDIILDEVEKTYQLNIVAMLAITKFALPHMRRGGAIVNSSSVAAYMGNPELTDYSGTKGAIASWTKALGLQLGPRGIRVNAVAPGIIYTVLQSASTDSENMDSLGKGGCPLQRPAQPSEVAPMYVFLAGPEGSYITSTVMHVGGGIETAS